MEDQIDELEFRSYEDDAWYNARLFLHDGGQTLIVRHPDEEVITVLDAYNFQQNLDDFRSRFRTVSVQLQDDQCHTVGRGTVVCASHSFTGNDFIFYDAKIHQVKRKKHLFENEKEECVCSFVLLWQHGPDKGLLTEKKIESICVVQPPKDLHPDVASFINMVNEKLEAAAFLSGSDSDDVVVADGSDVAKELLSKSSSECVNSSRTETSCLGDTVVGGDNYGLLIDNLETDLSPSTMVAFIYQQTSVIIQAYVFPSSPFDCYTRGIAVVDSEKDFEDLYDFLSYPDHFIVSSRGRPWVLATTLSRHDILRASAGTPIFASQKGSSMVNDELKVVMSGTEEYKLAKELRNILPPTAVSRLGVAA